MRPVLPVTDAQALLDTAQLHALEHRASASLPPRTLMQRAGESIARLALAITPHAQRIWIAAGPGNNGGDGLAAALHLHRSGKRVELSFLGDAGRLPSDAADAFSRAQAAGVSITNSGVAAEPPQLAIDALLGLGAHRAPEGAIAACIAALNALPCPLLAVDLPSGLCAETGQLFGVDCVTATHTLTLIALKPGLFTAAGRDHAGVVWLDDLGVASATSPRAWLSGVNRQAPRTHWQHKGSFGDVEVVGGAPGMIGAALLAARAAHAAGAGRVFVNLLGRSPEAPMIDMTRPELMFRDDGSGNAGDRLATAAVVCGCGGGDAVRAPLARLLGAAHRLVLDADALNALARDVSLAALLRARSGRGRPTVLTPHPLEAARLLECTTDEIQTDRLRAAQELADRFASVVVLKGSGSVIAAPGETPRINSTGNASLATAGTGDVLAGWLGGRWAQVAQGDELRAAFATSCQAVAEHGAAAEPPAGCALRASDLVERLATR